MRLTNTAIVEVTTVSDVVMLVPPSKHSQHDSELERSWGSTENTLIHGTVTVSLKKERTLKEILVELIARQSVIVDGFRHTYGIRGASVVIPISSRCLAAGVYHFPFEMVVPSNAAASERTPYGRTTQNLVASLKGVGQLNRTLSATKVLTISKGKERLPEHEVDAMLTPVSTVSQHSPGLPPPFTLDTLTTSANLGAIVAELSSPHLTVAGTANLSLDIRGVVQPLRLDDIRVEIVQSYETRALSEKWNSTSQGKDTIAVWSAMTSEMQPKICQPGSSFSIRKQIRLPREGLLRPSTPKSSVTGIKVSHKLVVVITYTPLSELAKKQRKEFCIGMPATFSSCHSMVAGNQLPAYVEKEGPVNAPVYPTPPCLCTLSEDERDEFLSTFTQEDETPVDLTPIDVLTLRKRSESVSTAVSASSATIEIQ